MGRSFHSTSLPSLSIHFPSARYSSPSFSFFLVSSFATISGIVLDLALVIVSANFPGGIRSTLIRPNVFFPFLSLGSRSTTQANRSTVCSLLGTSVDSGKNERRQSKPRHFASPFSRDPSFAGGVSGRLIENGTKIESDESNLSTYLLRTRMVVVLFYTIEDVLERAMETC